MNVPFVVHEAERVRSERRISALIVALIAAASALAGVLSLLTSIAGLPELKEE